MIAIKTITAARKADINLPNQPFKIWGRMIPSLQDGQWFYTVKKLPASQTKLMTFPDEHYNFDKMKANSIFIGAYDQDKDKCIGLAILQQAFLKYMYLYDLKVNAAYRGQGIGKKLIEKSLEVARVNHYRGLYTQGQDNNLTACLFYLKTGFVIGGFDNHIYQGTAQANKADIIFYHN